MVDVNQSSDALNNNSSNKLYNLTADLIESKEQAIESLVSMHYADVAELIDSAGYDNRRKLIQIIIDNCQSDLIARVLIELDGSVRNQLLDLLADYKAVFEHLNAEDALYILKDIDPSKRYQILYQLEESTRQAINEKFSYPENSVGRVMHSAFFAVPDMWTIRKLIDYLRNCDAEIGNFSEIYIIDAQKKPIGSVTFYNIIKASPDRLLKEFVDQEIKYVLPNMDQEKVSQICRRYNLLSMPVVDYYGKMIGLINLSDIIDIIEDEAEEDFMRMIGVNEIDLYAAFSERIKNRFPWLFINLLLACITSSVINLFSDTIHGTVVLAAIMPVVASMGGNAGTQSLTVIIRSMAHKDFSTEECFKLITNETIGNCLNGIFMAIIGIIIFLLLKYDLSISLIFAISVIINFSLAGFLGAAVPIFLRRMKIDPAVASSVFLTALTDVTGFFVFLGLASLLLGK